MKNILLFAVIILFSACKTKEVSPTFANIPDANFEKYLIDEKIDKDGVVNGRMNLDDAKGVTEIYVSQRQIKSLAGIEAFIDLQILYCSDNQLAVLDVSKNINLQTLDCFANQLTVLDVSKNVDLLYFWCYNNPIKTICVADITKANISISTKDTFGDFYWRKGQTATYEVCK